MLVAAGCGTPTLATSEAGELRIGPSEVDFGGVYLGQIADAELELTNTGKHSHEVALSLGAPFQIQTRFEIAGGSAAPLRLHFAPTAPGAFETALVIGGRSIPLRGSGLLPLECREPPSRCATTHFDPAQGQCVLTPRPNGEACASRCVTQGSCSGGSCVGAFLACTDSNACTDDSCTEEQGCVHAPKRCPTPAPNKCQAASCDPVQGCLLSPAADGTPCGPRDCHTNTTRVCIAAQCVERPLPTHECLNLFAYLKASNAEAGDTFGRVALSADGNTLAVGTFPESSSATGVDGNQADNSAPRSGAVYVFRRVTGAWIQEAYLKASNTGAGDSFGYSIALSGDGSTLVVGAQLEDSSATGINGDEADDSALDSGAAYLFERVGGAWKQQAYLKASNTEPGDGFGFSVALSTDGETVAVGASGEDSSATGINGNPASNTAPASGAVYVFRRAFGGWAQEAYLKAANTQAGDNFGFTVALCADGSDLAVAAPGEDSKATGINGDAADNGAPQSGAVFLFHRAGGWTQQAYLKASNTGSGDVFGISLSLAAEGSRLAVGAYGEDSSATGINGNPSDNSASQSGAAYVFRRSAAGWAQEAYLKASNTQQGDDFGFSLALSGDGSTLAIGAFGENSSATGVDGHQLNNDAPNSGAVYFFRRGAGWLQEGYLKASNTEADDSFGYALGISADGSTVVAAAPGEDSSARGVNGIQSDNSAVDSGAVFIFSTQ
ncbi:MAG: Integrin alpha beta-propellor repeat protein [Myxococcaceae bacterium]|nr:Integrin alpha beta-propellor repeat protein [Myxococcaceae bacterium]